MAKLSRRDFLHWIGAGSLGTGAGYWTGEASKHPREFVIPYDIPPEEQMPGIGSWYSSYCDMCSAGCGIRVRIREGRAKKIEGNPLHPINQGGLCARGQAGLQLLYNPDRLKSPLLKEQGRWRKIRWDQALSMASEKLQQREDKPVALLSKPVGPHLHKLFSEFLAFFPNSQQHYYRFDYPHVLKASSQTFYQTDQLLNLDIKNAQLVLSLGADLLGSWLSPVQQIKDYAQMREGKRGRLIQVEARFSQTGKNADQWLPVKPGTEGLLALGLCHLLIQHNTQTLNLSPQNRSTLELSTQDIELETYTPEFVARATSLQATQIKALAQELISSTSALVIAGDSSLNQTNGFNTQMAVNVLNYLLGNLNKAGGLNPVHQGITGAETSCLTLAGMQTFIDEIQQQKFSLIIFNQCNPVFTLPAELDLAAALNNQTFKVCLATVMDETSALADLILPVCSYLESWGDYAPPVGVGVSSGSLSQPVVKPLYQSLSTGDVFLALAKLREGDIAKKLKSQDMHSYLKSSWRAIYRQEQQKQSADNFSASTHANFEDFWHDLLKAGVYAQTDKPDPLQIHFDTTKFTYEPALFSGNASDYPYYFMPYLSPNLHDGFGANLPWLQALADPVSDLVYTSWVEINPATAKTLNIKTGDLIIIKSPEGQLEVPALVYPGIHPDVVAMPIGQGHQDYGRYASGVGQNPLTLVSALKEKHTQAWAWGATRISLEKTGRHQEMIFKGRAYRQKEKTAQSLSKKDLIRVKHL